MQPNARLIGMGGRRFGQVAHELIADSSTLGAMGVVETLSKVPRALKFRSLMRDALRKEAPGVFVPIDFGFFNVRLAREAKAAGWRVLYFIPPGCWRRTPPNPEIVQVTDEIVTPFPWSAESLAKLGASVHWFGHPLRELIAAEPDQDRKHIAILPGSRLHELQYNLPVLAECSRKFDLPFCIAVASSLNADDVASKWRAAGGSENVTFDTRSPYAVLKGAVAGLVCSGTATLEAVLCGCPQVVVYRGSKWMEIEYKIRRPKFQFFSLPNILAEREVVPELLQWDANVDRISYELQQILPGGANRPRQLAGYEEIQSLCGSDRAITESAQLALNLADRVESLVLS